MVCGINPLALGLALALAPLALANANVTHDNTFGVRPLGILQLFLAGSLGFFRLLFGQSPAMQLYHSETTEFLEVSLTERAYVGENGILFTHLKVIEALHKVTVAQATHLYVMCGHWCVFCLC